MIYAAFRTIPAETPDEYPRRELLAASTDLGNLEKAISRIANIKSWTVKREGSILREADDVDITIEELLTIESNEK